MEQLRSLVTIRNGLEELDSVLACIGVAVAARPLSEHESDGVVTIIRWSTDKIYECSQELGKVIGDADNTPDA